jgi:DNA-binding LacI/PurR family transcriptional regulator
VDAVGVDDRGGSAMVTTHLIEAHGRRRIALISGPSTSLSALDRAEGYRLSLGRHDLVHREGLVVEGDFDQAAGEAACRALLARGVPFDGIVAANDDAAVGAMRVLSEAGLRVPQDVSLVGFDDGPLAGVVTPSLTTIRQPVRDVGAAATERLLELIADPSIGARQREFPVQLVVRAS